MEDFIYGRQPVLEYLRAEKPTNKIVLAKYIERHGELAEIMFLCKKKRIPIQEVTRDTLDSLTKNAIHQGVLAYVSPQDYVALEDILEIAEQRNEPPFLLVLDGIEDPHNLGAIIRSAESVGAHGIVIPKRRSANVTPTVVKTSAGAISYLAIARESNINNVIMKLKERNVWVTGLSEKSEQSYLDADFKVPTALVIGGEGQGMSSSVARNCDFLVSIPMRGHVTSLNASVSAAVVMYEVLRQRLK